MSNFDEKCGAPCHISVHLKNHEIESVFDKIAQDKNIKTASDEDYSRRLHTCEQCDCLLFGTTCRWCGCLVQVMARLADSNCSYPYNPKW